MSEPTSPPAAAPVAEAKPAGPPPVIRVGGFAGESANDYFLKRLVPAWVISGAVNVIVLVAFISVAEMSGGAAPAVSQEVVQAVVDEKPAEEKTIDLTNPDIGLQSDLAAAVDVPRVEDKNVVAPVDAAQPIGVANNDTPTPTDIPALVGAGENMTELGSDGIDGDLKGGTGGTRGNVVGKAFGGRSGASKEANLKAGGGNDASEAAVARGLLWLVKKQKDAGNWEYELPPPLDDSQRDAINDKISATGLALLPFLAAGQTHRKTNDKNNKYFENVSKGVNFLIANQQANGRFRLGSGRAYMYTHAIATIALCELYGMTGDKKTLLPACKRAVDFIMANQGRDGSWGYSPKSTGDTSIVGWQIQALQSAKQCKDIPVDPKVLKAARDFLNAVGVRDKTTKQLSQYAYLPGGGPSPSLSAVGLLCRYYVDEWGPQHPGMADGVTKLLTNPPRDGQWNMYYYYYATQVVHFHEGDKWYKDWNPKMRDLLIKRQVGGEGKDFGSWDSDTLITGQHVGRLGTTCLALLTLEVYYRHLPLYKRDTGGLKELERTK